MSENSRWGGLSSTDEDTAGPAIPPQSAGHPGKRVDRTLVDGEPTPSPQKKGQRRTKKRQPRGSPSLSPSLSPDDRAKRRTKKRVRPTLTTRSGGSLLVPAAFDAVKQRAYYEIKHANRSKAEKTKEEAENKAYDDMIAQRVAEFETDEQIEFARQLSCKERADTKEERVRFNAEKFRKVQTMVAALEADRPSTIADKNRANEDAGAEAVRDYLRTADLHLAGMGIKFKTFQTYIDANDTYLALRAKINAKLAKLDPDTDQSRQLQTKLRTETEKYKTDFPRPMRAAAQRCTLDLRSLEKLHGGVLLLRRQVKAIWRDVTNNKFGYSIETIDLGENAYNGLSTTDLADLNNINEDGEHIRLLVEGETPAHQPTQALGDSDQLERSERMLQRALERCYEINPDIEIAVTEGLLREKTGVLDPSTQFTYLLREADTLCHLWDSLAEEERAQWKNMCEINGNLDVGETWKDAVFQYLQVEPAESYEDNIDDSADDLSWGEDYYDYFFGYFDAHTKRFVGYWQYVVDNEESESDEAGESGSAGDYTGDRPLHVLFMLNWPLQKNTDFEQKLNASGETVETGDLGAPWYPPGFNQKQVLTREGRQLQWKNLSHKERQDALKYYDTARGFTDYSGLAAAEKRYLAKPKHQYECDQHSDCAYEGGEAEVEWHESHEDRLARPASVSSSDEGTAGPAYPESFVRTLFGGGSSKRGGKAAATVVIGSSDSEVEYVGETPHGGAFTPSLGQAAPLPGTLPAATRPDRNERTLAERQSILSESGSE